jgi:uncharacterized protein (TIGR02284 family)
MVVAETIACLNNLIEASRNGQLGYAEAARLVHDTRIQTVLEGYAKERAGFVRALTAEVEKLGGIPAESGTVGAALHRGWMDVKSALTAGSTGAILAACESGEDSAWTHYKHAVDSDISGESRVLVDKQWEKVKEAIFHLKHLQGEVSDQKPD